ncbi:hypothetical protein WJX73_009782 [Symbiochloris irregularis]|uniref:Uncharacterized protein n=1 Tax=Symbiochloris irregularis TaxID=706552 RepID=A0AAW1PV14_9CHLO
MDLTLVQLVGRDNNSGYYRSIETDAMRWAVTRMHGAPQGGDAMHLNLSGPACCIVEGFSVPVFFSMLEQRDLDYSMDVKLTGFPIGNDNPE